jgi:uncharacterized cofD-like protein
MRSRSATENSEGLNVVAIGGGTGLSTLLSGLKKFTDGNTEPFYIRQLSAIVAVSDDGGSSGRLRDEFQMPPPGDIRSCMVALSEDSNLLSELFQYRFSGDGQLSGHNFGNLFLAALSGITGDFAEAVRLSSEILASKGRIYPATDSDVRLSAELKDGTVIHGETNIGKAGNAMKRLYLEPHDCRPLPEAIAAINAADVITLGPGSLYTSLLPPLLVREAAKAIADSSAVKIFICNLMTQPGETDGLTARQHLEVVADYAAGIDFDFLIVNDRRISERQQELYEIEGAEQIGVHGSITAARFGKAELIQRNLLAEGEMVRHDPGQLAKVVLACSKY